MPVSEDRLLTKTDVAHRLGVSEKTVDRLVASGKLGAQRVGGRYKFSAEDIERYLASQRIEQPPTA